MHQTKAPGPDDMAPIFYQIYWDILEMEVMDAVLTTLQSGTISPSLNHTFITLILKKNTLERVIDYRSISLFNILYKIIVKVLANCLKSILPHVISPTQKCFCSWSSYY